MQGKKEKQKIDDYTNFILLQLLNKIQVKEDVRPKIVSKVLSE